MPLARIGLSLWILVVLAGILGATSATSIVAVMYRTWRDLIERLVRHMADRQLAG